MEECLIRLRLAFLKSSRVHPLQLNLIRGFLFELLS